MITEDKRLIFIQKLVDNDEFACSFQSLGQYRRALRDNINLLPDDKDLPIKK